MALLSWAKGAACWVPDEARAYTEAQFVELDKGKAKVNLINADASVGEAKEFPIEKLLPRASNFNCTMCMDELEELHTASVLKNVEMLFGLPQAPNPGEGLTTIYSCVGPVLIAMNPFQAVPVYGIEWMKVFREAGTYPEEARDKRMKKLGPHAYRTAEDAYGRLPEVNQQSVVICGESGAGKTVTNRKMIDYLCEMTKTSSGGADPEAISEANILLEPFGNAKTTRNDNSSRFGKYTKLAYECKNNFWGISSCSVEHYLLERSRVCFQPAGERNYHVFFELVRSGHGKQYGLTENAADYKIIKDGADITGFEDAKDYGDLINSMRKSGFSDAAISEIMSVMAALLHLGNVKFSGDKDSSQVDSKTADAMKEGCNLLGVDQAAFSKAVCSELLKLPGQKPIQKEVGTAVAQGQMDTVMKTLYSRVFDGIVDVIDDTLTGGHKEEVSGKTRGCVGLLDIFGFEDMAKNGFEQMFINLTNERIQHLFNTVMFDRELKLYKAEGISPAFQFDAGNLETVKLFTAPKPPGIIKMLAESVTTGQDGQALVKKLNTNYSKHKSYKVCDPQDLNKCLKAKGLANGKNGVNMDYRECFQIGHYAGTLLYTVDEWVPKNVDALKPHLAEVLEASSKQNVKGYFAGESEGGGGKQTVGDKFNKQLEALATTLEAGEASFVRCIKSNPQKKPSLMNRPLVLEQLVNGGVIAALEMRQKGLPERMTYRSFIEQYEGLEFQDGKAPTDDRKRCERIMLNLFGEEAWKRSEFAFGNTLCFMQTHILAFLRSLWTVRLKIATNKVKRRWMNFLGIRRIRKIENAQEEFAKVESKAKSGGVADFKKVQAKLGECHSKLDPAVKALEAAKASCGNNVREIGKALSDLSGVDSLYTTIEEADNLVSDMMNRKGQVESLFSSRLARASDDADKMAKDISELEECCDEVADAVEPADLQRCRDACKAAKDRVNKLQKEELPAIRSGGCGGVDIEAADDLDAFAAIISPKCNEAVTETKKVVDNAMQIGDEVLVVRRKFQEAVKEYGAQVEAAVEKLQNLQGQARECLAEGVEGVCEPVDKAWAKEQECQRILKASKDPDAYKAAVQSLLELTAAAEQGIEEGKKALAKREAERAERAEMAERLTKMQDELQAMKSDLIKRPDAEMIRAALPEAMDTIEVLTKDIMVTSSQVIDDIGLLRSKVEDISRRWKEFSSTINKQITEASKSRKEAFKQRFTVFTGAAAPTPENLKAGAADYMGRQRASVVAPMQDPLTYCNSIGLSEHSDILLEISEKIDELKEDAVMRSDAQRCINHFIKYIFTPKPAEG